MGLVAVTISPFGAEALVGRPESVAPGLLNSLLVVGDRVVRIVEVEAYGAEDDPASHCHRGPTPRNASMFLGPGRLYVYRSYGIHWCANVVTGAVGTGSAVLLRGAEVVEGAEQVRLDRPGVANDVDLANGPGKLCAALGITGDDDGIDLLDPSSRVRLVRDALQAPEHAARTARVGITRAVELDWRFMAPGAVGISKGRPARAA